MDRPGNHLLARSGFTRDHDGRLGGGHLRHRLQQGGHGPGASDEAPQVEPDAQTFPKPAVFLLQMPVFHGALHDQAQLIEVERFGQVVVSPLLQGFLCGFHGCVGRHDDHGNGRVECLDLGKGRQPRDLRHANVHEDQVEGPFMDLRDRLVAVARRRDAVAPSGQQRLEHGAMGMIVVHHQDCFLVRHDPITPSMISDPVNASYSRFDTHIGTDGMFPVSSVHRRQKSIPSRCGPSPAAHSLPPERDSRTETVVPRPGTLAACTAPPWASTIF